MEASNRSPDPPAGILSLSTEILIMIAEELRYFFQRCNACNTTQAVWRTESNVVPMALTCRRFRDVLIAYTFVPRRSRGNCLMATFTCPCVLARMNAIAQKPLAAKIEKPAKTEEEATRKEAEDQSAVLKYLWKREARKLRRRGGRGGSSSGRGRG